MIKASEEGLHYTWLLPAAMRQMSASVRCTDVKCVFPKMTYTPNYLLLCLYLSNDMWLFFFPMAYSWCQVVEGKWILGNIVIAELTHYKTSTNGLHKFHVAKYLLDRPDCSCFYNCPYSSDNRSPAFSRTMPNFSYWFVVSDLHSAQTEQCQARPSYPFTVLFFPPHFGSKL